jgi:hypothetical protein
MLAENFLIDIINICQIPLNHFPTIPQNTIKIIRHVRQLRILYFNNPKDLPIYGPLANHAIAMVYYH